MLAGKTSVFVALGGNFLHAAPDTAVTAEALQRTALTVQISTKLNRSHLITGRTALILPTQGRTERDDQAAGPQFITAEDSMSVVHASRGQLDPGERASVFRGCDRPGYRGCDPRHRVGGRLASTRCRLPADPGRHRARSRDDGLVRE
ncbi:hypothetical protein AB0H36_39955 [Kribbella sp. NPDC050820]|uniref:hypothetical protein n=1 Tax=Kribbella sp. NPDC050820 TaxID=3155408 RepID=UPI0033F5534F